MSNKIIFKGKTYILEGEDRDIAPMSDEDKNKLPEEFFMGDENEETPLSAKDEEFNNEFAQADAEKEEVEELKGSLSEKIDYFYGIVGKYTTEQEMRRIIRVVYEIVAKRFVMAKRSNDGSVEDWKNLIKKTPSLFISEGFDDGIMNRLAQHFNTEIETPEDAMAFIMAISRRLNELAGEDETEGHNGFDEMKEDFDEHLQQIIA